MLLSSQLLWRQRLALEQKNQKQVNRDGEGKTEKIFKIVNWYQNPV